MHRYYPLIAAVVAAAVAAALLLQAPHGASRVGAKLRVPNQLPGGSKLTKLIAGREAVRDVDAMHWSGNVHVVDAAIAFYSKGQILWVARMPSQENATLSTVYMALMITQHQDLLPYRPLAEARIGNCTIFLVLDKRDNWIHAFWPAPHALVVWVKAGPANSNTTLLVIKDLVDYYGCTPITPTPPARSKQSPRGA